MNKAHRDLDKDSMILFSPPLPSVSKTNEVRNYISTSLFSFFQIGISTDGSTRAALSWESPDGLGKRQSVSHSNSSSISEWECGKTLIGELGFSLWASIYQGKSNSHLCLKTCKENSPWWYLFPMQPWYISFPIEHKLLSLGTYKELVSSYRT